MLHEAAAPREGLRGGSDAATACVIQPGHEARRSREPDLDGKMQAASAQPLDPAQDGLRLEAELRDDVDIEPGALRRRDLRHQRRFELLVAHARMAVRVSG